MTGHDFYNQDRSILFNWVSMQAGEKVAEHYHSYAHDCFILKGKVKFSIGGIVKELVAPDTVHFMDSSVHSFEALTDVEIVCTHPADLVPDNKS